MNHTKLEEDIFRIGLDFPDRYSGMLREQVKNAKVIKREFTVVGFFTDYEIPSHLSINEEMDCRWILGVNIWIGPEKIEGACVIYVEKGLICMMEGWAIYDTWGDPLKPSILTKDTEEEYKKFNEIEEWDKKFGFISQ